MCRHIGTAILHLRNPDKGSNSAIPETPKSCRKDFLYIVNVTSNSKENVCIMYKIFWSISLKQIFEVRYSDISIEMRVIQSVLIEEHNILFERGII